MQGKDLYYREPVTSRGAERKQGHERRNHDLAIANQRLLLKIAQLAEENKRGAHESVQLSRQCGALRLQLDEARAHLALIKVGCCGCCCWCPL